MPIAMMSSDSVSARTAPASSSAASASINSDHAGSRRRPKKRHYALGFGSNYFGALGVTVPPPPPAESVLPDLASGSTLPTGEDQEADAPYQWGHVSFLTLGQEEFRRRRQRPTASSTSSPPAQAARASEDATPPKNTASGANELRARVLSSKRCKHVCEQFQNP